MKPGYFNYDHVLQNSPLYWELNLRELMPHRTTECGHKMLNLALFLKTYANDNGSRANHRNELTQDTTKTTVNFYKYLKDICFIIKW